MLKHAVIPNAVRDLTKGDGLRNEGCVRKTSNARSFPSLRMTRLVL